MTNGSDVDGGTDRGPAHGSAGTLRADLRSLGELVERMSSAGDEGARIVDDVAAVLGEVDAAIGVDEAARAFRRGFTEVSAGIAAAADDAMTALERHRALIERGTREIDGADHDLGLRLGQAGR
ncbi:hypothetical protein [Gordonia insulae]|uniref:Uncharacterized protein n=1 Tax=Gordonia insulae TaxID=2420509 RepID=A0A3G8JG87_9ACTN|nr:hypothetical protein [Gordonia insulae]AZG44023.1 hypothetical protein D7316_00603 [Gordonia insulae]